MLELENFNELIDIVRALIKDQQRITDQTKKERKKQLFGPWEHAGKMLQFIGKNWTGQIAKLVLATCLFVVLTPAHCQEVSSQDSTPEPTDELAYQQSQLADHYKRLEMLIAKMAEVDALNNPATSALLRQAL